MQKTIRFVRRIEKRGRIALPKEVRCAYGIKENDRLILFTMEEGILIRKAEWMELE